MKRRNFIGGLLGLGAALGVAPKVEAGDETKIAEGPVREVKRVFADGKEVELRNEGEKTVLCHYESRTGRRVCDARLILHETK